MHKKHAADLAPSSVSLSFWLHLNWSLFAFLNLWGSLILRRLISFIWLSADCSFDRLIWETVCSKRPLKESRRSSLLALNRASTSSLSIGMVTASSCSDDKEMYKKACCACRVVVLLIVLIALLTFSLPSSLLKLPIRDLTNPTTSTPMKRWLKNCLRVPSNFFAIIATFQLFKIRGIKPELKRGDRI